MILDNKMKKMEGYIKNMCFWWFGVVILVCGILNMQNSAKNR
jgi:hypothetical protein